MEADLERARKGDRDAMARIVNTHYDAVFRFCARRLGPDLAADAAQETFLTAQRRMKSFEGCSSLATWLFGIAHNHCRNLSRKRKVEVLADGAWDITDAGSGRIGDSGGPSSGSEERTIVDRVALRDALAKLSPEHREVVMLHEVEGLTYEEAAEVIGVPSGTVKSRLHHAFLNLRSTLLGQGEVTA
jgi:RNA polymerase sigma-70 factor (ECF subfamily)